MSLEPGTQIGRFRIVRLIAQGGMAEVYRAEQELTGAITRPTALKVIRPEYSGSQDFREMFLDEARLACTLSHPNIVPIYEVGEADGRLFMAMELVTGESLAGVARELRERNARFGDDALVAIGIFTCSALEAVHALRLPGQGHVNLVHRDLSPHNLLLSATGALKLIDFGIAKATTNRNLTSAGVTKGKAGYFSPEQAMGRALDGRSDLFSLGITLYKLAWGGTPFDQHRSHQERNTALVYGRWEPLRAVCPGLPEGFYAIVDRALQVDPQDRFADAAEMRMALETLAVECGFHVGPSVLAGYVLPPAEDAAEVSTTRPPSSAVRAGRAPVPPTTQAPATAAGSSGLGPTHVARGSGQQVRSTGVAKAPAAPSSPPQPATALSAPHQPRRTERLAERARGPSAPPEQAQRTRRRLFLVSGSAVVVLATVAGLFLGGRLAREEDEAPAPTPTPQPLPVRQVAAERTAPAPDVAPPPSPAPAPAAAVQVQPVAAKPERKSSRTERRRAVRAVAAREPEPTSPPQQEPERPAPAVAHGIGSLRVGGNEDARVEVNGKRSPPPPFNLSVPAGSYTVVVRSLDGKRRLSRTVEVRPDHASKLIYDLERSTLTVGE